MTRKNEGNVGSHGERPKICGVFFLWNVLDHSTRMSQEDSKWLVNGL